MPATEEYIGRAFRSESVAMEVRRLSAAERLGDALFTGLRLAKGIDLAALARPYGVDVWQRYGQELAPFVEEGLLQHRGTRLSLTRRGMLLAHEVMAVFV